MKKKYRIGLVGFAHMHVLDQIKPFLAMPERVEWIGAADVKPMIASEYFESSSRSMNLRLCREQCGFETVWEDYRELLEQKPELVLVNCENAYHGIVIPEILSRGIHVVVEKPLAYSAEHAMAIDRAARIGGAQCMINWPTTWQASIRLGQKLVSEGAIGKVYRFQFRNPDSMGPFSYGQMMTERQLGREWWHQEVAGGGSLLDYCCYGTILSNWYLGEKPQSVYGLKANFNHRFGDAEDYAAITVRYPEAVSILEGTWNTVSSGYPSGPIVWGEEGALIVENGGDHGIHANVCVYRDRYSTVPSEVYSSDDYPLLQGRSNLAEEVFHHLETGEPIHYTMDLQNNLWSAAILDAGIRSSHSQKMEMIKTPCWTIG